MSDMASAPFIGLVVEAPADAKAARILVDRAVRNHSALASETRLDDLRRWRGVELLSQETYWKQVRTLAATHSVRSHGYFSGEPGAPDAQAARRVLLLFAKLGMPDAVVLMRDADNQPERREGLAQARDASEHHARVAIGVAEPEREAWVLAGFEPRDDVERTALARERKRLGFDPSREPHELRGNGKRSAKTALAALSQGSSEREHHCLAETRLEQLRACGERCGLKAFLDDLDQRVVPAVV